MNAFILSYFIIFLPGYYYDVVLKTMGAAMVSFPRTAGQIIQRHVMYTSINISKYRFLLRGESGL